jgi:RNA polymerase-binding transcription factor DksA
MHDDAQEALDAETIARDLDGVEVALARLDAGAYWTCEATGEPLTDELLAADPTIRRLPAG